MDGPARTSESIMPQQSRTRVLITHGDPFIAAGLVTLLRKRRDFEVFVRSRALGADANGQLPPVHIVVADYDSGLRLLESASSGSPRVVILTQHDGEAKICRALERGIRGYLLLGCSLQELTDALRTVSVGRLALGPLVVSRMAEWMKQQALTRREEDILRQVMLGVSNKEIAGKLTLAIGTVKTHVKAIMRKLGARSRTEAVVIAQRRGIPGDECQNLALDGTAVNMDRRWGATDVRDGPGGSRLSPRGVHPHTRQSRTVP